MSDMHAHEGVEQQLDQALAELRYEEPVAPLRRDLVWSRVERARSAQRSVSPLGGHSRRWAAAAVMFLVAGLGTLAVGRLWQGGPVRGVRPAAMRDPLLSDAAAILRALPMVASGGRAADSLQGRSALLLAATRAAVDRASSASERVALLRDVEYVLAQVVEGGLQDEVERELALDAIRARRLITRVEHGGAE